MQRAHSGPSPRSIPNHRAAVLTFSSNVVGFTPFSTNRSAARQALEDARVSGETALYDAAAVALRGLREGGGRRAVVLFTDGEDNRSRMSIDQVIDLGPLGFPEVRSGFFGERSALEALECYLVLRGLRTLSLRRARSQASAQVIAKRLAAKDFHFLVAEDGEALVGAAAMQGNWHLYHLFVARGYQRGGLAWRLWQILRDEALSAGPPRSFKANVPRYSIAAYTRLGFKADGAMRDEKGVRFQPMTCPAKRLEAAAAT